MPESSGPAQIDEAPGWLAFVALAAAAGMLSFGFVGLALAVNGWYTPGLVFPLGLCGLAAVLVVAKPVFATGRRSHRDAHAYAAVGVAAIIAITVWNAAHVSQHVLINRDGGSYANTGRWIAREGSLGVDDAKPGPFAAESTLRANSPAVYETPGGKLEFQFAHLLPVVLAEAYAIGGDRGLFHAPALLGGIALLAFFVLAWRLFRQPLFAVAATLAFGLLIPQVAFSRDSYSEIPMQILLFTGIWLLVDKRVVPPWRIAFVAGLFVGATQMARIDALAHFIGVPLLLGVAWLRASERTERRERAQSIGAFVAGLVPGVALGLVDLAFHSTHYWHDLAHKTKLLGFGIAASTIVMLAVVLLWPAVSRYVRRWPWPTLATAAGVLVGVAGFAAWILRPRVQTRHGKFVGLIASLQRLEHLTVDGTRTYGEYSLTWMQWYVGPITLAAAIVGAALLVRALILGRFSYAFAAVVLLVPESLVYLYRANAVGDHVWVDRRFLSTTLPAIFLLAFGLAAHAWQANWKRRTLGYVRIGGIAFAVLAVGYSLHAVYEVEAMTEQRGFLAVIDNVCDRVGDNAAIVVLQRRRFDLNDVPQPLRSWCGAAVVTMLGDPDLDPGVLRRLAREWHTQGRRMFVVAGDVTTIEAALPEVTPQATLVATDARMLERSVSHRPDAYMPQRFDLAFAEVP